MVIVISTRRLARASGLLALLVMVLATAMPVLAQTDQSPSPNRAQNVLMDRLAPEQRAWLEAEGPLRVGFPGTAAPVIVTDEDGEVSGGWMTELVQLAALKLGIDVEPVVYDTVPGLVAGLESGDVHVAAGLSTRPDLLAFAEPGTPWAWTPVVLMVSEDVTGVDGLRSMAGRRVTTIPGSPIEARLVEDFPEVTYLPSDGITDGIDRVATGEVDGFLGPLAIVGYQLRDTDVQLFPVGEPIDIVEVGVWSVPGNPAGAILEAGRQLITDTELGVIHVRWTGFDLTAPGGDGVSPWVWRGILIGVASIALLGAFVVLLRRQVNRATSDLRGLSADLEQRVGQRTAELAMANGLLAQSNGRLAEFANTVAHDLRGPVTAITGMAEMLAEGTMPADRTGVAIEMIRDSTLRLDTMISDLLGRARNSIIDEVLTAGEFREWLDDLTAAEVDRAGTELVISSSLDDADVLAVDVAVLRHVVTNVVGNAIKYGTNADGAAIAVHVSCVEGDLSVVVEDNGPGIPADDRERVFEVGFQADEGAPGLGMGLPAVREALAGCGGSIEIGEAPSGGTSVRLTMPRLDTGGAPA